MKGFAFVLGYFGVNISIVGEIQMWPLRNGAYVYGSVMALSGARLHKIYLLFVAHIFRCITLVGCLHGNGRQIWKQKADSSSVREHKHLTEFHITGIYMFFTISIAGRGPIISEFDSDSE